MRQLVPPAAAPVSTSPMPSSRTGVCDQGGCVRSGGAKGSVLGGVWGRAGTGRGAGLVAGEAKTGALGAAQAADRNHSARSGAPAQRIVTALLSVDLPRHQQV